MYYILLVFLKEDTLERKKEDTLGLVFFFFYILYFLFQ